MNLPSIQISSAQLISSLLVFEHNASITEITERLLYDQVKNTYHKEAYRYLNGRYGSC
jgi:hypothetical protein